MGSASTGLRDGSFREALALQVRARAEHAYVRDYTNGRWVLAEADGELVGCACRWPHGQGQRLSAIYVVPACRGRGISSAMVAFHVVRARMEGARFVDARVARVAGPFLGWEVTKRFQRGVAVRLDLVEIDAWNLLH